uniref:Uncharacterized protein n=1 Tax=Oryza glumipatula TaxID=40148 RepID=A0A0D9Z4Y1_9ORYZ
PPTPPPFPLAREHQISGGERGPRLARERKASGVEDADLREDADGEDHHPRGGEQRRRRQRQGQDPGQGRYPAGPAAPHLRREAAGGWPHAGRLQHPEGVHASPGASPTRRPHLDRALAQGPRLQAQHQQDGAQGHWHHKGTKSSLTVLCNSASQGYKLPQEEVWPQQSAEAKEGEVVQVLQLLKSHLIHHSISIVRVTSVQALSKLKFLLDAESRLLL